MKYLVYDSTFEGFLTAVFAVFEYRYNEVTIVARHRFAPLLFGEEETVYTDAKKAQRVLTKIEQCWGKEGVAIVLRAFLSEETHMEDYLLEAIRLMVKYPEGKVLENFAHRAIASIHKAAKSVGREVHRMKEFVRFEKVGELYFAKIVPEYDVLPLVVPHFKTRFSDQQWVLYDPERGYGFIYNLHEVLPFTPADKHFGALTPATADAYQTLWKTYFQHINIAERKNAKYQMRNMPKRYWQYLPEA